MTKKKIVRSLFIFSVLIGNIGCDQVSKSIARSTIEYGERIVVISNHMTLTKIENTGAFLSLGTSLPDNLRILLLTILPVLVMLGLIYYVFTKPQLPRYASIGLAFIIGGGIGNLTDRILYGSVTDFLHIDFALFQTGIFNLADVSIVIGTILLVTSKYVLPSMGRAN